MLMSVIGRGRGKEGLGEIAAGSKERRRQDGAKIALSSRHQRPVDNSGNFPHETDKKSERNKE